MKMKKKRQALPFHDSFSFHINHIYTFHPSRFKPYLFHPLGVRISIYFPPLDLKCRYFRFIRFKHLNPEIPCLFFRLVVSIIIILNVVGLIIITLIIFIIIISIILLLLNYYSVLFIIHLRDYGI